MNERDDDDNKSYYRAAVCIMAAEHSHKTFIFVFGEID
jgi:hypothetical protein